MYEVKQWRHKDHSHGPMLHDIILNITRAEAAALIRSLSAQLEDMNPNSTMRVEAQWTDKNRFENPIPRGYFTVFVSDEFRCINCDAKIEPYTGTRYPPPKGLNLLCKKCAPKVCEMCRHLQHAEHCPYKAKEQMGALMQKKLNPPKGRKRR